MRATHIRRPLAVAMAGALLAGGAALTTATSASAAPTTVAASTVQTHQHGHGTCTWHPGWWENKLVSGQWSKAWHSGSWQNQ
ncbi:hypothetical protein OG196_02765 [Kitasatospora purpeofusca]|uniref:hypothetical protein n=1 Tax=Kitasatospora purpeofusca TaxID=67352 RepID=UPI002E1132F2|nr:hypothetical protein OG715_02195 [Kitasatospora purpeofusca]WSR38084.1 hypothetical protein OG196_02765 [Kitasatospora purpeofusca]